MRKVTLALAIFIVGVLIFNVPISCALNATAIGSNIDVVRPHAKPNLKDIKVNYTKVDTIYGSVNVPAATLKKLGTEKIAEKYSEFLKQNEEFSKIDTQLEVSKTYATVDVVSSPQTTSKQSAVPLSAARYQERCKYYRPQGSSSEPMLLYGWVYPGTVSNPYNENFISYQEREIALNCTQNGYQDWVEVICQQYPDCSTDVAVCIYDNSYYYVDPSIFSLVIHDVSHPVSYEVIIDSVDQSYDIWLVDTWTSEVYFDSYTDDNNFSSYITAYLGSTELDDDTLAHQYIVSCTFVDYRTKVDGYFITPYSVFSNIVNDENAQYVYAHGYQSYSLTYSDLAAGNPDPSH